MSTKTEVKAAVVNYLVAFDPEEFSVENSGDRAEKLAEGLIDHLEELEVLNLTDIAEVEEPAQAESVE